MATVPSTTTGRAPFPTDPADFDDDTRISYSKTSETHVLEDEHGEEWEWLARAHKWVPVTDEALMEQQRQAYRIEGVDEDAPALDPRKRKADAEEGASNSNKSGKKPKANEPKKERVNTAVYITSLPADVTVDELHQVFSRIGGVIAESPDTNQPRIKLYSDDDGNFKGDALIIYHRPESVQIAIDMLDETDFRLGQKVETGPMRVSAADTSYKSQKDQPIKSDEAKKKGTSANRDRQKVIKKAQEMDSRLADWDDDDPQAVTDTSNRWDKIVVLKHMFTLAEIASDAAATLEIKDDVREECAKFGTVTNVVLYDKEEEGVVTVRFDNAISAKACVKVFNGRWFDKQKIEAYVAEGKEKFKKSKKTDVDEVEEEERLEQFSRDIEKD